MKLTKKECLKAVEHLYLNGSLYGISKARILGQLIKEHFDNPPLKFEEIKVPMWIWDSLNSEYIEVVEKDSDKFQIIASCAGTPRYITEKFKENRFYRKQIEE